MSILNIVFNDLAKALFDDLNKYKKNIFSQNGEDGIIEEILIRLNIKNDINSWCCEFGACDGIRLSNTFFLVKKGWKAVYIESDKDYYRKLLNTASEYKNIYPINSLVDHKKGSQTSLDVLLKKTDIPKNFDILSIDIDSYDCDVWENLENYNPKIVIIEINSRIPPGILQRHNNLEKIGNSFSSTLEVALKKGYILVCHTGNLIFVRKELASLINIKKKYILDPQLLFDGRYLSNKLLTRLFYKCRDLLLKL
jgi:hypothetical protein